MDHLGLHHSSNAMGTTNTDNTASSSPTAAAARDGAVWVDSELASPHVNQDKHAKVQRMFGAIARSYDLNNRLHSLWQDQRWRKYAVRVADVRPGETVLDVACGTGDLSQAFARFTQAAFVQGLDFTPEMLDLAKAKRKELPEVESGRLAYMEGDAQRLPFADASFDVVSIAFGIRNVADPDLAIREFARVLRPRGRLVILEFERPRNPLIGWFNDFYCGQIMPRTATWISRDSSGAYRYLPKSVGTFWSRERMHESMANAGFSGLSATPLSMGICVCYRGQRAG